MNIIWSKSTVPPLKKGVQYLLVDNLLYQITFFSYLTVPSLHCVVPTSHVTDIWWFPYIFLTFDDSILTLYGSNITYDSSFVTLGGSLTFFSHFTVPSSHCVVPTSHVTVLLSH